MKFTKAWAEVASENVLLKIVIAGLLVATVSIAFALTTFALKEPLLIARECQTDVGEIASAAHTESEIRNFLKVALRQRFHQKEAINESYFVQGEVINKADEAREMQSKGIDQKIIVNDVKVNGDLAAVDADRILILGKVKSIMPFPLNVKIASIGRSKGNPYGLKIMEVTRTDEKDSQDEK